MREAPRQRREVSHGVLVMLKPVFRYSVSRDAYVLRGVGQKMGPVLIQERRGQAPTMH